MCRGGRILYPQSPEQASTQEATNGDTSQCDPKSRDRILILLNCFPCRVTTLDNWEHVPWDWFLLYPHPRTFPQDTRRARCWMTRFVTTKYVISKSNSLELGGKGMLPWPPQSLRPTQVQQLDRPLPFCLFLCFQTEESCNISSPDL